jgi:predicted nucleic acid-binding protein
MSSRNFAVQSRRVFVDSSGFLALVNPHDTYHEDARAIWTRLTEERWGAFTSNFVMAETHTLFLARLGHSSATAFLRNVSESSTVVVRLVPSDEDRAREIIYRYDDKDFSFTDATSFAVMERLRIGHALTFDRHFAQFGFPQLAR